MFLLLFFRIYENLDFLDFFLFFLCFSVFFVVFLVFSYVFVQNDFSV